VSQQTYTRGLIGLRQEYEGAKNAAVAAVVRNVIKRVKQGEAAIGEDPSQSMQSKHSKVFDLDSITDVEVKETQVDVKLRFKADGKKYKFDCPIFAKDMVNALSMAMNPN
jgi:hypothetical protein